MTVLANQPVAVLGAGSWGTALAIQLARNGHQVRLWGHRDSHNRQMRAQHCNERYLSGIAFPATLSVSLSQAEALAGCGLLLLAVPSHAFPALLEQIRRQALPPAFSWATKGLEHGSGRFLHQLVLQQLGSDCPAAVISGPSFAAEVAAGMPTAVTVASADAGHALDVATLLHGNAMLAYTSTDVVGVELGGAVKNVLAIAAGIADGLGFGANARAAVITRGVAELCRLGLAAGGRQATFMGLTGVGDLVLTCTDNQSRNRRFGLAIGRGKSSNDAMAEIGQVVEGAHAVREIMRLARTYQVAMPICEQVEQVLHHQRSPREAVELLLARTPGPEYH